jgi:hypothetical protein
VTINATLPCQHGRNGRDLPVRRIFSSLGGVNDDAEGNKIMQQRCEPKFKNRRVCHMHWLT